jgi:crescentin
MSKFVTLLGRRSDPGSAKPTIAQRPPAAHQPPVVQVPPAVDPLPAMQMPPDLDPLPAMQMPPAPQLQTAASLEPVPVAPVKAINTPPNEPEIELDNELFFPIATQLGQENETVRNLLMDAEHKIGELDSIKVSIARLVEPVCNTLRGYEETKSEKLILQRALNTTREVCNKLRDDLSTAEKKATKFKIECTRLQEIAALAKQTIAGLERTKAEQLAELGVHRAHIAELQGLTQQQASDLRLTRDENLRLGDRVVTADQRIVQVEGESQASQQETRKVKEERASLQASLEKTLSELAQTARRLSDADKAVASTQARLKATEINLAEVQTERSRLVAALDEANHAHREETNVLNSRLEALQARGTLTDKLLEEARQALIARSEEMRTFDRRVADASTTNDTLAERLSSLEAILAERELQIRDLELARALLTDEANKLIHAATAREGIYQNTQQDIREKNDLVELLEEQIAAAHGAHEMQIESLQAQLQREQLERSMAEGALETARKDVSRLQQEVGTLRSRIHTDGGDEAPATQDRIKRAA